MGVRGRGGGGQVGEVGGKPEGVKPSIGTVWTSYESQKCQP